MHYLNGQFVNEGEEKISVFDLGLLRGYGVFDYLRTYQRTPFHLKDHLDRLAFSAREVGLEIPFSYTKIEEIITHLLRHTPGGELGIKMIVTGGVSEDHITPDRSGHLIVLTQPLNPLPISDYLNGIATVTTHLKRSLPTAKTLQYTPAIMALKKGKSINAKEALYLNDKKELLEATTSNFFAFTGEGKLLTCESDEMLLGITRSIVLNLAAPFFPIEIAPISLERLDELVECFITSSTKEVLPVTRIDDRLVGSGQVGPRTRILQSLFEEYTSKGIWNELAISRHKYK